MAAAATQRRKCHSHLHHDFPSILKPWGTHRFHRCDALDGNEEFLAGKHRSPLRRLVSPSDDPDIAIGDGEIGLEEIRKKLLGHLREATYKMKLEVPPETIPWNLRSKRASRNKAAIRFRNKGSEHQKFSVSLTREEIDEDVFALTGSRPRLRPKKRARIVQRHLDAIFPGLWLSEITPKLYRVPE